MSVNPRPQILLYPRIRKSPFFYASRQHGVAMYSVYNRTYHPRHYGDPVAEYWSLLNGVTLWDVGVERQIEITGPDAFDFTNLLVTRDLTGCQVGQCKYVFLTDDDGGILNDPVLLRLGENHFWLSLADSDILLWARGVAYRSGYDVQIREADVGPLQVQGPKSAAVMRDIIWQAGRGHGLEVIGPSHIRRIEGGILAHGCDITFDTNPFEVGMGYDWMVSLDQDADFIGKQALRRIRAEGPRRMLAGVEIAGPNLGSFNDGSMIDTLPVHADGRRVGEVTSACYSPRLERNIGYAMVPTEFSALGTRLQVDTGTGLVEAVVVPKPFIDPAKDQPKQDVNALLTGGTPPSAPVPEGA